MSKIIIEVENDIELQTIETEQLSEFVTRLGFKVINIEHEIKEVDVKLGKNICKYCDENKTNSNDPDMLCEECAATFGHSKYSEL